MKTPRQSMYTEEQTILRARKAEELSAEESFRELYDLYARSVFAWFLVRVSRDQAEDLFQEVWAAFLVRWRVWEFREHLDVPEARPVLSFLFRTAAFLWQARRRKEHPTETLTEVAGEPSINTEQLEARVELGRCLDLASRICPAEEMDVLLARLAGLSGAETAQALGVSESIVDHRYRSAIQRLRRRLELQETP